MCVCSLSFTFTTYFYLNIDVHFFGVLLHVQISAYICRHALLVFKQCVHIYCLRLSFRLPFSICLLVFVSDCSRSRKSAFLWNSCRSLAAFTKGRRNAENWVKLNCKS